MWRLLTALLLTGCVAKRPPEIAVTVVLRGSAARSVGEFLAKPAGEIRYRVVAAPEPATPPAPKAAVTARIGRARAAYVNADFGACLHELADPTLLPALLADGAREQAARLLFWRVACESGAGEEGAAVADAEAFATLGFEASADLDAVSPRVESVLAQAMQAVADKVRVPLAVTADTAPARLSIDGREAGSLPATVELAPGDHWVLVDADGEEPVQRSLHLAPPSAELHLASTPAAPEAAARQWGRRYRSNEPDSEPSMHLLSTALRSPLLVLLEARAEGAPEANAVRLRAALARDGSVVSRSETAVIPLSRSGDLLHDLLVKGRVIEVAPLWKRWTFWAILAAASVASAAAAGAAFYHPPVRTTVGF